MRYFIYSAGALGALIAVFAIVILGVPAILGSGQPLSPPAADFTTSEGWIVRPDTQPDAVWESGWAIDVIMIPQVPDTLSRHGLVSTTAPKVRRGLEQRNRGLVELLDAHGAVYMPALRLPSQASADADWETARGDLAQALASYLSADNRGRAIAFYAEGETGRLLEGLPDLLRAAQDEGAIERVVMLVSPAAQGGWTAQANTTPNGEVLELGLEPGGGSVFRFLAWPNASEFWQVPGNTTELAIELEAAFRAAVSRAEANAPKTVEPFGAMEIVREAPVNRPCEAGLRCRRD